MIVAQPPSTSYTVASITIVQQDVSPLSHHRLRGTFGLLQQRYSELPHADGSVTEACLQLGCCVVQ
eukprot:51870-Eustigmatos_ZCMA.PRE.1